MTKRKPVIGVMGGSRIDDHMLSEATQLGRLIAGQGWALLTGGRSQGVMAAVSRGAKSAGGWVIGVLPGDSDADASADLDVAIVTNMGDARNVINVLSSDVVIACAGGPGTLSEIALALKAGKRVILLNRPVPGELQAYEQSGQLIRVQDAQEAIDQTAKALAI